MNLDNLILFLCIVEKGSLVAAGRELNLSATTVSERLVALESHYGVTLLNRTTRALSLTEEGRTLVEGSRHLLTEAQDLKNRLVYGANTLSGSIRVSATFDIGRSTIEPLITKFLEDNPKITIELLLADGFVNIVDEGIDIAVRFGNLANSTLRARNLGRYQRVVCASPDYIRKFGTPSTPQDLSKHNCLLMRFGTDLDNHWHFKVNNEDHQIIVTGNRTANDGRLVHDWCLAGYGIALKSEWDIGAEIASGKLVRLLNQYSSPPKTLQMLFPPARNQPRRVKEFAKKITEAFSQSH